MRIMSYNILEGGLGRIDPIAEVIRQADPDVVIVPETWVAAEFEKLADRLRMECFQAEAPRNPHGHIGLLTRLKLLEAVNYGPLDDRLTRAAFHAVVENRGQPFGVIGVHLHPKETVADEQIRLRELDAILAIAGKFKAMPHVIAGDFNAQHPQQIIDLSKAPDFIQQRLMAGESAGALPAGMADRLPRAVIARILAAGYVDAHALGRAAQEFQPTFTTAQPVFRIDYIFVSPDLSGRVNSCQTLTYPMTRFASDHLPVLAEIV